MKRILHHMAFGSLLLCIIVGIGGTTEAQSNSLPKLRVVRELRRDYHTFGVTWSADGTKLAAYSRWSGLVTVWNADGAILSEISREGDHYVGKALAFIGSAIVSRPQAPALTDAAGSVFDATTGEIVAEVPGPHPGEAATHNWAIALASSSNQSLLAAAFDGGIDQQVALYSTRDWTKVADIPGFIPRPADNAKALAFSADGRLLAIGLHYDVLLYDVAGARILSRIRAFSFKEDGCCISAVAFNPDASQLAVSTSAFEGGGWKPKTPIKVFRVSDATVVGSYSTPLERVWDMSWSPDGRFIAFIARDALHLWDPSNPQSKRTISLHIDAFSLAFAPDGRRLATCDGNYVTIFEIGN